MAGDLQKVGLVGWRGMVGSILMNRMEQEQDFALFEPIFFSTSNAGGRAPVWAKQEKILQDAKNIDSLRQCSIIISTQGSDYTAQIYPLLRSSGWDGYWIDAASLMRQQDDAVIILDPINRHIIDKALGAGVKNFIGGNCTNSILLMGLGALFKAGLVEWVNSMTYQAASGAGAKHMRELLEGMGVIHATVSAELATPASSILDIDRKVAQAISTDVPTTYFGAPLAGGLIPWIDAELPSGQSKEEAKGQAEINKILATAKPIPVDGLCVRIGAMRCHSLALTVKLTRDVPLSEIEQLIATSHQWVDLVPNSREQTVKQLIPANYTANLKVGVGRLRKLSQGSQYLSAFVIGDQLLWGAAEPLRRMLRILLGQEL